MRWLPVLLAAWIGSAATSHAETATAASTDLKPISREELMTAAGRGEPVTGRRIEGKDVAAVLAAHLAPKAECASHGALLIRKSTIDGEITLASKLVADEADTAAADDDDDDEPASGGGKHPEKWLAIPWSVTDSTVNDPVSLRSVGLSCALDFSRSAFNELVQISAATFMAGLVAEAGEFRSGFGAQKTIFNGALVFRRAKFAKNFESVSGRFEGNVDFRDSTFSRLASFIGSRFAKSMDFRYAQFAMGVNFSNAALGRPPPPASFSGPFYMADFGGLANFRRARFAQLKFLRTQFRNGADFNRVHGKSLQLLGVTITGRLALDGGAAVDAVQLDGWGGSMIVDGDAVFRGASIDNLTLKRMVFRRTVDFQGASIRSKAVIETVSFEGDLHFDEGLLPGTQEKTDAKTDAGTDVKTDTDDDAKTDIKTDTKSDDAAAATPAVTPDPKADFEPPKPPEIKVSDITLSKGFYMDRDQFFAPRPWWAFWRQDRPRFLADDTGPDPKGPDPKEQRRIWRELAHAFGAAKNTELLNYAEYRGRRLEEDGTKGIVRAAPMASRLFWGYGVRPLRTLGWLAVLILAFALVYWTQLSHLAAHRFERARRALSFSARTAWEFKYGYDNSATVTFRVITLAESILAKLTLAMFFYALTQTNPLLSELTKKLLP